VGGKDCPGIVIPTEAKTLVYRLTNDQLHPTEASKQVLAEIAQQWGHHSFLKAWNLKMRGF